MHPRLFLVSNYCRVAAGIVLFMHGVHTWFGVVCIGVHTPRNIVRPVVVVFVCARVAAPYVAGRWRPILLGRSVKACDGVQCGLV
jgi:hypothetical protein